MDLAVPTASSARNGAGASDFASTNKPGNYARFCAFTLEPGAEVLIDLDSHQDSEGSLLQGRSGKGVLLAYSDDVETTGNINSQIMQQLGPEPTPSRPPRATPKPPGIAA